MTGLFELLNPLFGAADSLLAELPSALRVAVWGVFAGAASMALYALVSPQERLKRLAEETRAATRTLRSSDVRGEGYRTEMVRSLKTSLKRVGVTLGPALLSALPVLFAIGYVNATYSLTDPVPGEPVAVLTQEASTIEVEGGQPFAAGWTVAWPESNETVRVFNRAGEPVFSLTADARPGTARKSGVLALLLGAPAGKLAPGSPVDSLQIETTPISILQPGLSAQYQWAIPFVLAVILSSLLVKFVFRIS